MRKVFVIIFTLVALISNSLGLGRSSLDLLGKNESQERFGRIKSMEDFAKYYSTKVFKIDRAVMTDALLTTPELLENYGYPSETHTVETQDGYILEMHRIPKSRGIPVYLQHGLLDSSGGWVIMGPQKAFAYKLADLGYDVWMGNNRGNRYSRKHTTLNVTSPKFWDFSFHEIGLYDVPAMIDYILKTTEFEKLHYIGHSQGTTAFWVMCSEKPEYCDKIISMQAMAPIAFLDHAKSPVLNILEIFQLQMWINYNTIGSHEFLPNNVLFKLMGEALCNEKSIITEICGNALFLIAGFDADNFNSTMLPAILGHVPAGASSKQFTHYTEIKFFRKFQKFNYGLGNLLKHGSTFPPEYNLKNVTAPVALYYSMNDWLADVEDVRRLKDILPNVIKDYIVPEPTFGHLDFLFAMNCYEMVQQEVVKVMEEVESSIKVN